MRRARAVVVESSPSRRVRPPAISAGRRVKLDNPASERGPFLLEVRPRSVSHGLSGRSPYVMRERATAERNLGSSFLT
jgi:hypothetical protein